ncbi:MAG: hypothetical protein ACI39E_02050 [Acutalibacteraceae bacterium]
MELIKTVMLCTACMSIVVLCIGELRRLYRAHKRVKRMRARRARIRAAAERDKTEQARREREKAHFYLRNFWEYDGSSQRDFEE